MNIPKEDDIFKVIRSYLTEYGYAYIQKKSYENLIYFQLDRIVQEEPCIQIPQSNNQVYKVKFSNVMVDKPYVIEENRKCNYLTPAEARLRDLTYDAPISVNITEELIDSQKRVVDTIFHNKVIIGRIPIMTQTSKCNLHGKTLEEIAKTGECKYDRGGYFVIKGKERVLVSQERPVYDNIHIYKQKTKNKYIAEIRSMSEETGHSVLVQAKLTEDDSLTYSLPYICQDIPVGIVLKALGVDLRELTMIPDKYHKKIIQESYFANTTEEALEYIGLFSMHQIPKEKRVEYSRQMLENELFPHMGIVSQKKERAMFLLLMVTKLIDTETKKRFPSDRDHISNKRCETAGILIADIFRSLYKRFFRALVPHLEKRREILVAINRNINHITKGFRHCMATGNWGTQNQAYFRKGVSQVVNRLTYSATISHFQRLVIPIGKEGKNTEIRQIHNSQYGYFCPTETPEGHSSGIVKNFSLFARISDRIPTAEVIRNINNIPGIVFIKELKYEDFSDFKIMVNGFWFASTKNPEEFVNCVKDKRQRGVINLEVSVTINDREREIYIFSDEGRVLRPLVPIKRQQMALQVRDEYLWSELIENHEVVYLDSYEVENHVIAMTQEEIQPYHTYCEIHPCLMLGVCGSIIPFPDHTQSPRNTYQSAMVKQALGVYSTGNDLRADTTSHMMICTQKPAVYTQTSDYLKVNDLPYGVNAIVAIMTYTGFNQEDSILINQSAIDRGLFRTNMYKTVVVEEKKMGTNSFDTISVPEQKIQKRNWNYTKLDHRGIIRSGERVEAGDVLVGKVLSKRIKSGGNEYKDTSVVAKANEDGVVDRVFISKSPSGYLLIKVKIRNMKIPEIGDKFASRHAQKGTCGMVFRQEDMPFTMEGIVPDVIMNPHAIPSRMTINWLLECVGGKSGVIKNEVRYATPFTSHSTNVVESLQDKLKECGYNRNGNEILYNGFTGEQYQAEIFIGPVYYQRLKHLVSGKIHARDFGNVQSLTRQPLEGRSRGGGLRFGEMERDCMISHGVSAFLKERLFDMSDPYQVKICNQCGEVAAYPNYCKACGNDRLQDTVIPYAFKLLTQELIAMGIKTSLMPQKSTML